MDFICNYLLLPQKAGQPQAKDRRANPTLVFFFLPPSENCHRVIVISLNFYHTKLANPDPQEECQPQPQGRRANPDPREGRAYPQSQSKNIIIIVFIIFVFVFQCFFVFFLVIITMIIIQEL